MTGAASINREEESERGLLQLTISQSDIVIVILLFSIVLKGIDKKHWSISSSQHLAADSSTCRQTHSPLSTRLLLTICIIRNSGPYQFGLFHPRSNRSSHQEDDRIKSKNMIMMNSQGEELDGTGPPPLKRHLELEIKTLENAPRDAEIS
jgi:hypothetical protein